MGLLPEVELTEKLSATIREDLGFVPNVLRAQSLLPRAIDAELQIVRSVLLKTEGLSRVQKERLLLSISLANDNAYCRTLHAQALRAFGASESDLDNFVSNYRQSGLSQPDLALVEFVLELSQHATWIGGESIDTLRVNGFSDEQILESVAVAGLGKFLCTLAAGLKVEMDFKPEKDLPPGKGFAASALPSIRPARSHSRSGPYLRAISRSPETFAPFAFFEDRFGFIPNIFRAQTLRPDIVEAEAGAVRYILLTEDVLTRVQKEYILLIISALNLNTYCVAVHCEMLRNLGIPDDQSDQIAINHRQAGLSTADTCLLDSAVKLAREPHAFGAEDVWRLRTHGFTDSQILEFIVMASMTQFLTTVQMGLGTIPDFEPLRTFAPEDADDDRKMNLSSDVPHPMSQGPSSGPVVVDEDIDVVRRVQAGDIDAFDEVVRRHRTRIYRTLCVITEDPIEAKEGMENVFVQAFQYIVGLQTPSTFGTWLTGIAINEGLERLRSRKTLEPENEEELDDERPFRPGYVISWGANPEQLHPRAEIRQRVEQELLRIPLRYRLPVVLRDMEQLSNAEAAQILAIEVPALKSRLLRGRLMLREALAPSFAKGAANV